MTPVFKLLLHLLPLFVISVTPPRSMLQRSVQKASVLTPRSAHSYRHHSFVTMERKGLNHVINLVERHKKSQALLACRFNCSPRGTSAASTAARFAYSTDSNVGIVDDSSEKKKDFAGIGVDVPPYRFKAVPINLYVDSNVRSHLRMRNSDRKARVFLTKDTKVDVNVLRGLIEKQFTVLSQQPYLVRYKLPGVMPQPRPLNSEVDTDLIIREIVNAGSLQLYIEGKPGVFPPPTEPYLLNMEDPAESTHYTMVSFYKFHEIDNPEGFTEQLFQLWRPFKALGRVYVAKEGLNAQCAIPSNVLAQFRQASETLDMFSSGLYLNIDHELTRSDYEANAPFKNLHIRVRSQIVADGFDKPLNWESAGREISPKDWHDELDNPEAIVLDCRNSYESEIGTFQNAIPLNTTFFRESWDALEEILHDKPKDAPIMTYCTGGIRCVKINAFLEQKMGFTNVGRLEGGIISYTKELEGEKVNRAVESTNNSKPFHLSRDVGEVSKFKGMNYVFDERMGARITGDILTQCETCGVHCDLFKNCENYDCHIRFIQCEKCVQEYRGCCCVACEKKYGKRLEAENKLLTEDANKRRAKLQRDQAFIPTPRSAAKRAMMPADGVTRKQMLQRDDSTSASKVIDLPPENDHYKINDDKYYDRVFVSDRSMDKETTPTRKIHERISSLETSIHDLKEAMKSDHEAASILEKEISKLEEQCLNALEEMSAGNPRQKSIETVRKEEQQLDSMNTKAIDKLATAQTTSVEDNDHMCIALDAKDVEIRHLKSMISELRSSQVSKDAIIASFEKKESNAKKEADLRLRNVDNEFNANLRFIDQLKSQQVEKDGEISRLNSSIESLKASIAHEETKTMQAEEEKKKLEDEKNDFKDHAHSLDERLGALSMYTERYSSEEPSLLNALRMDTVDAYGANAARMVSGHLQGRILKLIVSMLGAQRVLELGTFTGYASLCLAEGLDANAHVSDPKLITCEPDAKAIQIARKFFEQSSHGSFIDSREVSAEVLMQSLREKKEKFDVVFIDADKRAYREYLVTILGGDNGINGNNIEIDPEKCLLADGGIIIVDNTLWKGLVMYHEEDLREFSPAPEEFGKASRMEKLAGEMHDFNAFAKRISEPGGLMKINERTTNDRIDSSEGNGDGGNKRQPSISTELIMLPLRDGLTILRINGLTNKEGI